MERYQRVRVIGRGSFGCAVLCRRKTDSQLCVIKQIQIEGMKDEERGAVMNEVHILASLKHPNIISLLDSFIQDKSMVCIVMEFADEGDLYAAITQKSARKQFFGEEVVLHWFVQIALAIKYIHERNILHRDIKSQNVFLTSQGLAKLGDFGIAKALDSGANFAKTLIGTPYNMSPELCEDKPYDQKSDIWSFGCLLYEMLTLNHAFNGTSLPALIMKIVAGKYPPIASTYSEQIRALCQSMLLTKPDERPSISDILAAPIVTACLEKIVALRPEECRRASSGDVKPTAATAATGAVSSSGRPVAPPSLASIGARGRSASARAPPPLSAVVKGKPTSAEPPRLKLAAPDSLSRITSSNSTGTASSPGSSSQNNNGSNSNSSSNAGGDNSSKDRRGVRKTPQSTSKAGSSAAESATKPGAAANGSRARASTLPPLGTTSTVPASAVVTTAESEDNLSAAVTAASLAGSEEAAADSATGFDGDEPVASGTITLSKRVVTAAAAAAAAPSPGTAVKGLRNLPPPPPLDDSKRVSAAAAAREAQKAATEELNRKRAEQKRAAAEARKQEQEELRQHALKLKQLRQRVTSTLQRPSDSSAPATPIERIGIKRAVSLSARPGSSGGHGGDTDSNNSSVLAATPGETDAAAAAAATTITTAAAATAAPSASHSRLSAPGSGGSIRRSVSERDKQNDDSVRVEQRERLRAIIEAKRRERRAAGAEAGEVSVEIRGPDESILEVSVLNDSVASAAAEAEADAVTRVQRRGSLQDIIREKRRESRKSIQAENSDCLPVEILLTDRLQQMFSQPAESSAAAVSTSNAAAGRPVGRAGRGGIGSLSLLSAPSSTLSDMTENDAFASDAMESQASVDAHALTADSLDDAEDVATANATEDAQIATAAGAGSVATESSRFGSVDSYAAGDDEAEHDDADAVEDEDDEALHTSAADAKDELNAMCDQMEVALQDSLNFRKQQQAKWEQQQYLQKQRRQQEAERQQQQQQQETGETQVQGQGEESSPPPPQPQQQQQQEELLPPQQQPSQVTTDSASRHETSEIADLEFYRSRARGLRTACLSRLGQAAFDAVYQHLRGALESDAAQDDAFLYALLEPIVGPHWQLAVRQFGQLIYLEDKFMSMKGGAAPASTSTPASASASSSTPLLQRVPSSHLMQPAQPALPRMSPPPPSSQPQQQMQMQQSQQPSQFQQQVVTPLQRSYSHGQSLEMAGSQPGTPLQPSPLLAPGAGPAAVGARPVPTPLRPTQPDGNKPFTILG